jgi:hypothetical protein
MKADLTRSTDRPDQHYRAVRMQQGRVQLDAEWNEQQDILNRRIETETRDTLGTGATVPIESAGFQLTGVGKNVSISAGRCYVQGLLCEAGTGLSVIAQPGLEPAVSPVLPASASLLALPPANAPALTEIRVYDAAGTAVLPTDGTYIGYIEAWLRHITPLEDPLLREVALGVPDTTTRDQLVWQVKLLRAGDLGDALSCMSYEPWNTFTQAPDGMLAARAEPSVPPKDPCLLTPEAGYRRLENQLYRVEIHDDGSVSGKARFKWSRDNGSIVTRVTRWLGNPAADAFEVASIGRDATLAITAGCWVEFFDDTRELLCQPGVLVQVLKTAGNVVTVDLASKTGALDQALFTSNPRVRRWDGWAQIASALANTAAGWVELEDGIEVKFTPGRNRIGDYWTVPARTASANIEWPLDGANKPRFMPPQGVLRAFARLAILRCTAGVWTTVADCRHLFPALGALTNLVYVGGDGQEAKPNPLAPAPVALPQPLEVAVFNGQYPVMGALVRFTASHGALPNGTLTQTVTTGADGVANRRADGVVEPVVWRVAPNAQSQTCTAELLEAGAPAAGKFNQIHFSASLAVAAQIAYDPAKCAVALAAGINNVQDALDALCLQPHGGSCCLTVGEGGDFPTLDVAIGKLIQGGTRDICLCLLAGEHQLADTLDVQAHAGTHLLVHGAGLASRLVIRDQVFKLEGFASVTLEDFEVQWRTGFALLTLNSCAKVRLAQMGLSGFTQKGVSLLQVSGAALLEVTGCRISGYAIQNLQDYLDALFQTDSWLNLLKTAFDIDDGGVFAPIDYGAAEAYAGLADDQRKSLVSDIDKFVNQTRHPLGLEGTIGFQQLRADILSKATAPILHLTLESLRNGVLLSRGGAALALLDAHADALLADNRFNGSLSLYGEYVETRLNDDHLKSIGAALDAAMITLTQGRGQLRLRNNRLRGVRLGEEMTKGLLDKRETGGVLNGCYRSLVADANTLTADTADLLAFGVSLSTTVYELNTDVGFVIASQGKYLGNFADNECHLSVLGHTPEKFGNGGLNVVQL